MKKILSLIIAFSLILSMFTFVGALSEGEVVFKEDFEKGLDSWKPSADGAGKFKIDNEIVSNGKASLKVTDDTEAVAIGLGSMKFDVAPDTIYTLSASLFNQQGNSIFIRIRIYDANGKRIDDESFNSKDAKWETKSVDIFAPSDAAKGEVYISATSTKTGVVYIDDIVVTKGKYIPTEVPESTGNLEPSKKEGTVFYENFEQGLGGWKMANVQSMDRIKLENTLYSEGKACIRVTDNELEKAIGISSEKFPIKPGSHTLAFDFYLFSGNAVCVYIRVYDNQGNRLFRKSTKGSGRKWSLVTLPFEAPEGAYLAEVYISGVSTTQGEACIDNVAVYEGTPNIKADFSGAKEDSEGLKEYTFPDVYEMPDFKPTIGHPRVYFNKNDIEKIKLNAAHPENSSAYNQLIKEVNSPSDGSLNTKNGDNLNIKVMSVIQSKAFYYAVWGDQNKGKEAIASLHNFLNDANIYDSEYNAQGYLVFTIATVYDWCYPLLNDEDKKHFQNMGLIAASSMEIGFPPAGGSVLNAHSAEAQLQRDQLAFALAVYDERPDIYKNVAGRFFTEMVDSKKFLAQAKSSMFGNSYSTYRYQWEVLASYMMEAVGIPNIYGEDHGKVLYWNLYARRPDGSMLRDGDSVSSNQPLGPYDERGTRAYFLAGNYYKDPYLKGEALRHNNGLVIEDVANNQTLSSIEVLCFNDPQVTYKSVKELPLSMYYPSPRGEMIARTSWAEGINAPTVVAQMKFDEFWTQGHDHLDSGEFEIYYKGALANDTGYYQAGRDGSTATNSGNTLAGTVHYYNYQRRTIAHNCMVVFDPDENIDNSYKGYANDGGQIFANNEDYLPSSHELLDNADKTKVASVLRKEIGTDTIKPDYTYIKGDLEKAYGEKVSGYERSFMFLNLNNSNTPAAMIVFDRVVAKDKAFKKKWLLHGLNEPQISGNRTIFTDTRPGYNGKLTVDTLLPKADNLAIDVIGKNDDTYLVNGVNYWAQALDNKANEGGGYRLEVSPKAQSNEDYFLNVLQVSDASDVNEPLKAEMLEANTHLGVKIADRVVMLGKGYDVVDSSISFSVSGEGTYKYVVADLQAGTWQVVKDGTTLCEIVATEDGGIGSFEAGAGLITLNYLGSYGEKLFTSTPSPVIEGINLKLEPANKYIYSDVEPFTVNGRTLIPLRAIFEALDAKVTWDEATLTATGEKDGIVIKITENSQIALVNGKEVKLDSPAIIKDGRFVVPVRFVAESFGIKVDWDDLSKTVIIMYGEKTLGEQFIGEFKPKHNIENALTIYNPTQSADDGAGNNIKNSYDGSFTTSWGVKEDINGNPGYGIFDLGSVKTIDKVHIAYNMGDSRVYSFSIYVSDDGKNFTPVKENLKSSGKTTEMEAYDLGGAKGRYIKYVAHGNSSNQWSNMLEILFVGK